VSDSENDPLRGLLSEFALGPAWARQAGGSQATPAARGQDDDRPRRDDRGGDRRGDRQRGGERGQRDDGSRQDRGGERGGRREFRGRDERRDGPPQRQEEAPPARGVRVSINPDPKAVHLIGREIHQVARVYPLFDIARILLAERARCRAVFESDPSGPALFRGKKDESLFLTRDEALRHFWQADWRGDFLEEETIEADPPSGNFQAVARCGLSGEWLGPPNFHAYQTNLRRLHRERFAHMAFEAYSARVRTERGQEAVDSWLETMKQKTRWRLKGDPEAPWTEDRADIERAVSSEGFAKAFKETRSAEISAAVPAKNLSPSLLTTLRLAGSHARKHPATLIPAVCRALEAEHLPVFKRQGKLHTGPARPHALAAGTILAERPAKMVAWIRDNKPAKLAGLWQAVLPEGTTEPTPEFAADLFWLLQQGHILLYADDTLVLQEPREPTPPAKPKEKKPKPETPVKPAPDGPQEPAGEPPAGEAPAEAAADHSGDAAAAADEAAARPTDGEVPPHDFMPVDSSSDTGPETSVTPGPPLPGPELLGEAADISQDPSADPDAETQERLVDITSDASELSPEEQALSITGILPSAEDGDSAEAVAELNSQAIAAIEPESGKETSPDIAITEPEPEPEPEPEETPAEEPLSGEAGPSQDPDRPAGP